MRNYIRHVKEKLLESIQSLESQKEMLGLVCLSLRHAKRLRKYVRPDAAFLCSDAMSKRIYKFYLGLIINRSGCETTEIMRMSTLF